MLANNSHVTYFPELGGAHKRPAPNNPVQLV